MASFSRFGVAVFLAISLAQASEGTTLFVPDDEATIQGGVNAVSPGDTVLVRCGTYYESRIQMRPSITLRSETGDPSCVTIDGSSTRGTIIYCPLGIEHDTRIEGLTLTRGDGNGMTCFGSPTVMNCVIVDNRRPDQRSEGGGVGLRGSSARFINCVFANNLGAAMVASNCPDIEVTNSTFYGNYFDLSRGMIFLHESTATLRHCIIAFNRGPVLCSSWDTPSKIELHCCNIFGNQGGDWVGCIADQGGLNGNLSLDPRFCDAAGGNWHLCADSPCAPEQAGDCGLIGALPVGCAECAPQALEPSTWGRVKHQARRP